jgi:hypothetical protein
MQTTKPPVQTASARPVPVTVRTTNGKKVALTGDFTNWSLEGIPMKSIGGGRYRAQLLLPPGDYQFRILVDGEWADDLDCERKVSNPFGTENSILAVS